MYNKSEENEKLCPFDITAEMVKSKLLKLKMKKALAGQILCVDSVGTRMLLELSEKISDILAVLFTKSLNSGDDPVDWKLANVTTVLRKVKIKSVKLPTRQFDCELCKIS